MDPEEITQLPVIAREASLSIVPRAAEAGDDDAQPEVEVVWTTGQRVQRVRWEGWDLVEYEEELDVSPGAIRLDRLRNGAPFLDSHRGWSLSTVLGAVVQDSVRIANGEGTARIRLTTAEDAKPIVHRILERTINKVSVGYRVYKYEITKQDGKRDIYRAVDWEPYEISAVAMPADSNAVIRSGESGGEQFHRCVVVGRAKPAAAAAPERRESMDPEEQNAAAVAEAQRVATEQATTAERERASAIASMCQRHGLPQTFRDDLVSRGVTLDAARSAILDHLAEGDTAGRTTESVPAQARQNSERDTQACDAMSGAIMHRASPGLVAYDESFREFRGMTLMEMARSVLERHGMNTRGMSKMELAAAAFTGTRMGGLHSTSDFPAILANVVNKTLRSAYESTPRTFQAWARRATISDFKPVQRTQLGGAPDLELLKEGAEFTYGTIGEGREVYALSTYGRIVGITRQTLINDDLDAFTRIPTMFGASAADLESDLVYSILNSNPNMGDGNPLFGASNTATAAAITEASVAAAYRLFAQQTGIEGRLLSILPAYILVPPGGRDVEARKLITATTPNSTADVNTFANRLQPITEPRLLPASGADPWFLAADSSRIDTIEYAYLEGQEGLFTEQRLGFEVDGMEIKARHDFATKAIDRKGLFKNAGV